MIKLYFSSELSGVFNDYEIQKPQSMLSVPANEVWSTLKCWDAGVRPSLSSVEPGAQD